MKPGLSGTQTAPAATAIDRHRSLWSVRQYHRYAVTSAHTEAAQPANRIVHPAPECAICHRGAPGRQDGVAVGRHSPIVGKKIFEAQEGTGPRSALQLLVSLDTRAPFRLCYVILWNPVDTCWSRVALRDGSTPHSVPDETIFVTVNPRNFEML